MIILEWAIFTGCVMAFVSAGAILWDAVFGQAEINAKYRKEWERMQKEAGLE